MYTVQLKDIEGTVIEEKQLVLTEGDKLIVQHKDMSIRDASIYYKGIIKNLESESKVIGIPPGIELKVLRVE